VHKGNDNENSAARAEAEEGNMSIFTKEDRELLQQLRNGFRQPEFIVEQLVEEAVEDIPA
jgi:hypothetical protein